MEKKTTSKPKAQPKTKKTQSKTAAKQPKKKTAPSKAKAQPKTKPTPSKAEQLVSGVHVLHDEALELAEAVVFMAEKLEESREALKYEKLVVPYDNGGGQTGIRENPHFTAYEKLLTTYNKSLRQLTEIVEKGAPAKSASKIMAELTSIAGRKIG